MLLKSRGMLFENDEKALAFLSRVSYFRLKYYWMDMLDEQTEHDFYAGSSFWQVVKRYEFDRRMRQILFNAVDFAGFDFSCSHINGVGDMTELESVGGAQINKDTVLTVNHHDGKTG